MSAPSSLPRPEVGGPGTGGDRWMVTIFNNDTNSMDEVVEVLIRATGCDLQEASIEMWEAHHLGKSHVHFAAKPECEEAAKIISSVGIQTEVQPEWQD